MKLSDKENIIFETHNFHRVRNPKKLCEYFVIQNGEIFAT